MLLQGFENYLSWNKRNCVEKWPTCIISCTYLQNKQVCIVFKHLLVLISYDLIILFFLRPCYPRWPVLFEMFSLNEIYFKLTLINTSRLVTDTWYFNKNFLGIQVTYTFKKYKFCSFKFLQEFNKLFYPFIL